MTIEYLYAALGAVSFCAFVLLYMGVADDPDRVDLPQSSAEL